MRCEVLVCMIIAVGAGGEAMEAGEGGTGLEPPRPWVVGEIMENPTWNTAQVPVGFVLLLPWK